MIVDSEIILRIAMQVETEDEHLEFKAARNTYDFEKLSQYCAALSNEGGGHIILGVTDQRPREIVGTHAFTDLGDIKSKLLVRLKRRIEAYEIMTASGRVLSFHAPAAPRGHPVDLDGRFLMRVGENLVSMTGDRLRALLYEGGGDLSVNTFPGKLYEILDSNLVSRFRAIAAAKCKRRSEVSAQEQARWFETASDEELLDTTYLTFEGEATWAALILMGTERGLSRLLPQAEIIFEYRSNDGSIDYQERKSYRRGFLGFMDDIWSDIAKRNEVQSFQSGLARYQIPTFSERSVREALLNAMCHRSYYDQASVIIRQFPRRLEVISPGSFPPGVTPETILRVSRPRNRLLHEAMERCGLVERSGQGADLMFMEAIKAAKPVPSYEGSDQHSVFLTLNGQVRDASLLAVLEKAQGRLQSDLDLSDLRIIDAVFHNEQPSEELQFRVERLVELGIVERAGRKRLILARNLYAALGRKGAYTRRKGLSHETEKALLLQHVIENNTDGSPMRDLIEALPALDRFAINALLDELRQEGRIHVRGQRRQGRWFSGTFEETQIPLNSESSKDSA